jgi:predicted secreted Zn-dependent protease
MTWRAALFSIVAPILLAAPPAMAEPTVSVRTTYYSISGTTSAELKSQMRSLGPKGFWAYTNWYVRWSGDCRVSLEISYTFPQWTNEKQAPAALQAVWKTMIASLQAHEEGHGRHGRSAAAEIDKARCKGDPKSVTNKWAAQDKVYDAETNHGRSQGVVLP